MHADAEVTPQGRDKQKLTEKALENLALELSAAEHNLQSRSRSPSSQAGSEKRDSLTAHPEGTKSKRKNRSLKGSSGDGSWRRTSNSSGEIAPETGRQAALALGSVELPTHESSSRGSHKSGHGKSSGVKSAGTASSEDALRTDPSASLESLSKDISNGSSSSSSALPALSEALDLAREEMRIEVAGKSQADLDIASLRLAMEKMAARHNTDMSALSKKLSKSCSKSTDDDRKIAKLLKQIADLRTDNEEHLRRKTASRRAAKKESKDENEQIAKQEGHIVQLHAEHEQAIANLRQQMQDASASSHHDAIRAKASTDATLQASENTLCMLKEELAASQLVELNTNSDRNEVQMQLDCMAVDHAAEFELLANSLEATRRELQRRDEIDAAQDPSCDDGRGGQMIEVSAMLAASRNEQRNMAGELRDMRLELLGLRQDNSKEVGDMQSLLDVANRSLEATPLAPGRPSPKVRAKISVRQPGRGRKTQPAMGTLASIEEEHDDDSSMDGSVCASGIVSSDGEGVVAELADFEEGDPDATAWLHSELADSRRAQTALKETMAGKTDANAQQIWVLQEALQQSENERDLAREGLRTLQSGAREDAAKESAQNMSLHLLLEEAQKQHQEQERKRLHEQQFITDLKSGTTRKEIENESLRQQLSYAIEAKKNADLRLEDLKREVESNKRRQASIEVTLQRELLLAKAHKFAAEGGDQSDAVSSVIETETRAARDLKEELCNTSEYRSTLLCSMENQQMQWKDKVQSMEETQIHVLAELKRQFEIDKKVVQHEQNNRARDLQDRLDLALLQLSKLKAAQSSSARVPSDSAVAPEPAQTPLWRLMCPSRMSKEEPSLAPPESAVCAPCRYVIWRVVGLVNDSIALLCNSVDFEILEASKRAFSIWGSASLRGHSLMSLVKSPMRASWMQSKIREAKPGMGPVPKFMVKDLQCMELQSKEGTFDASVVVAHLPDELGKPPSMLAIFQQLSTQSAQQRPKREQQGRGGRLSRRSGYSPAQSMASSSASVSPSDSVSCIAEKLFGMY